MKLGGSLGNVPQKMKKSCYKNSIYFGMLVHFHECNLYSYTYLCALENGLTVQNISSFYNKVFIFCGTLLSDPPNFIKIL
jgi:hypothetical protein